ncbi:hypothetical protein PHLGIDRAFT_129004 [Phlebiopsis gigantea 11061_1 CR5-6]|uniref:Blue (type 1) copper domain-containing protein n=1 Tax=Phlebiopsis gigantea (strain 11061_1 CR5-6) TaxID=745531 RepID=A0A0C3S8C3_PHLG1|nr:hypothetical protein PHLGIDRAFT_129004 [Phlebiopsis gigantea 11061_1 CR5-6]
MDRVPFPVAARVAQAAFGLVVSGPPQIPTVRAPALLTTVPPSTALVAVPAVAAFQAMRAATFLVAASAAALAAAERIQVLIGANTTANVSQIFQPAEIHAKMGDVVVFNFTNGTYDLVQATFDAPCIPAHDHNASLNGFNTGPRPANNGTSITTFELPITDNTTTIWFYENSTCGLGGVGGININDSSTETLAGFVRNAIRLNGTNSSSSSSALPSSTGGASGGSGGGSASASATGASASHTSGTSPAARNVLFGGALALPFAVAAFFL